MDKDLQTQLIRSIFQFKKLVSSGFGMDMEADKSDINLQELVLMNEIADNSIESDSNVALSEVRLYLAVSKAAISQMLTSLEKKGYINRDIDKNNRRNLIVTLTDEGRKTLEIQSAKFRGKLGKIISRLGENEVKQMITIVNRMIDITAEINAETEK